MSEYLRARFEQLEADYRQLERRHQKTLVIADKYQADYREVSEKLMDTTVKLRELQESMLPVCMHCKRVRTEEQIWSSLDKFLFEKADLLFTHGVCPTCLDARYGRLLESTPPPSSKRGAGVPREDATTQRFETLLDEAPRSAEPWRGWLEDLLQAYRRLLHRFIRVTQISDGYQHDLRESNLQLAHAVRVDRLTQLMTRPAMVVKLILAFDRPATASLPAPIALVRLDGLRMVNEAAGIVVGDALIQRTARRLASSMPGSAESARWSAAEFLVFVSPGAAPPLSLSDLESAIDRALSDVHVTHAGKAWSLQPEVHGTTVRPGDNLDAVLRRIQPAT